nr:MAG TPA: hypothetical protein [Caudoviricetes sp.]
MLGMVDKADIRIVLALVAEAAEAILLLDI